tara:strand:- start:3104 stop:4522 length:1419 start_codon:yes stop_codon:yes gene_type:complete
MPTYVNDLRLTELNTGEGSGTWGTTTNTNLELIGESLGYGTEASFSSDANATTTVADGSTDPARSMYFKVTSGATLTATRELTIAPNTVSRVMYIENATTGSQSITIKQGSGGTVTIGNGNAAIVYLDGAGSGAAVIDANTSLAATKIDATTLAIGGTAVTSTAAELNILDGVTSTASELNLVDGSSAGTIVNSKSVIYGSSGEVNATTLQIAGSSITSTAAELNILDGVTSTATELNLVDGSTADTVVNSKAVIYGAAGQVTANELDVDNIQIDANAIKSTDTNGNIQLFPNGTGFTELYGNTNAGTIRFNCESNSHGVTVQGPAHSAAATYTVKLPDTLGLTQASGIVTSDANGVVSFDNGTIDEVTSVTSSSNAATINLRDGNVFEHDLTENVTYTFSNPAASGRASAFVLKIIQDSSARTITWPGSVDWAAATAPTLTTTNNGVDVFVFLTIDGGTTYYGFTAGQAMG